MRYLKNRDFPITLRWRWRERVSVCTRDRKGGRGIQIQYAQNLIVTNSERNHQSQNQTSDEDRILRHRYHSVPSGAFTTYLGTQILWSHSYWVFPSTCWLTSFVSKYGKLQQHGTRSGPPSPSAIQQQYSRFFCVIHRECGKKIGTSDGLRIYEEQATGSPSSFILILGKVLQAKQDSAADACRGPSVANPSGSPCPTLQTSPLLLQAQNADCANKCD